MIINFFEAWNWFERAKVKGCTFKEWREQHFIPKDKMYDVPECDADEKFVAWVKDRKNPKRTFFNKTIENGKK